MYLKTCLYIALWNYFQEKYSHEDARNLPQFLAIYYSHEKKS